MKTITLTYRDLSFECMVKISELADLLGVTPKRAKEIFLAEASRRKSNGKEAA